MTDEYITSTISAEIPEFLEKYVDGKTITIYKVNITNNFSKQNWTLEKRYSEFEYLYKTLVAIVPNVPIIPGKSLFRVTAYDALTKRRLQLEAFIKECANRKDILSNDSFKNFIELDRHAPEVSYNAPTKIFEYTELPLGVRDFYYYKEKNLLFVVCCDMNIASRVDAYITNVNLPWEKKTDAHISVGATFAFKVIQTKDGKYLFEKLWAKSFPEQTGVVNFDTESNTVEVGLDSGAIIFYRTNEESKFIQYDEICKIRPHKGRVMGLAFNYQQGYIYSCSSDKKFYLSEINFQSNVTEIAESAFGYTNLEYDKPNARIFLTNEGGALSIFTTTTYPPTMVNLIQTHSTHNIRGLHIDYKKLYIFTATNKGDISILDLGLPGKEKLINEISYFGGNLEIRIVRYNVNRNGLVTGDQNGKITVWSLKTGQSIYAWQAHASAITQIDYDPDKNVLFTVSKDKKMTYWQLPNEWINEEISNFEKNEIKNINDTIAMLRMQKTLTKMGEGDDSSDDSLCGWDIRP